MAKVMVIAGGMWQKPIARKIKEMGHYVICSNLYEDSPAFPYADEKLIANVLDKEKNLEFAKKYKPDAVLTDQSDIAVPTVAFVAQELGMKGIGVEVARRFTDKYIMRECAHAAGVPVPQYRLCETIEEVKSFIIELGNKGIIKPVDSQSSRGVHIIQNLDDVDRYFEDCIQYSNVRKAILVEEYIDGTEFTVDGLKTETEYVVTAISEKEHFSFNHTIAKRLFFSNTNPQFDYDELRTLNTQLVNAMGLPFGLTHAEYKFSNGRFYLIEIAARGGGTRISSDIVPIVSGINSNEQYLNVLLGNNKPIQREEGHEYAVLGFFDFQPGRIIDIQGLREAKMIDGVVDVVLEVNVGEMLGQPKDDRARCGYYIIYGDSAEELNSREYKLKETVRVMTE